MTRPLIRIHNVETNEVIDREMTEDELSQQMEDEKVAAKAEKEAKAKAAARQEILDRLGLTEEEMRLLLG